MNLFPWNPIITTQRYFDPGLPMAPGLGWANYTIRELSGNYPGSNGWLAGWLAGGWLAGWRLAGWLAGGWLAGWLAGGWLAGWRLAGWLGHDLRTVSGSMTYIILN